MTDSAFNAIPAGVRCVAALFALCGIYLAACGLLMLARPGAISMMVGAPLLFGLEISGPYMFLIVAVAACGIAWGLIQLNNIMRHAAILAACAGIVMLIPTVSGAVMTARLRGLATGGFGIIIRVMVAWYLSQAHVADEFKNPNTSMPELRG